MRPTIDYITAKFKLYNDLIFDNILIEPLFRLSRAGRYYGQLRVKLHRKGLFKKESIFILSLSIKYDREESDIIDTLIHEMIHLYIKQKNIKDSSAHGRIFRDMMHNINLKYNRSISITTRPKEKEILSDQKRMIHKGLLIDLDSQKCVCFPLNKDVYKKIHKYYKVKKCFYFESDSPFFNKYPRTRTHRIYKITNEEADRFIPQSSRQIL